MNRHVRHHVRGLAIGLLVGLAIVGIVLGVFLAVFGWGRLLGDFWPLDNSRIGPNLCASFVIVVGITARNEARTIEKDEDAGLGAAQVLKDVELEALHPTEQAEEHIADDVKDG